MIVFSFDRAAGREITSFGSRGVVVTPLSRGEGFAQMACFFLEPGGFIGAHEAGIAQIFIVAQGEGWVCGTDRVRTHIGPGQAAFWEAGEWHEAGTDTGMSAFVLEGERLEPSLHLQSGTGNSK